MEITTIQHNETEIAIVSSDTVLITDVETALDFMATIKYEAGCSRIIVSKTALCEDFYRLATRLAGEILQKFINYQVKLAIIGDFFIYESKSFRDFVYECNNGKDIFFLPDQRQAIKKLSNV